MKIAHFSDAYFPNINGVTYAVDFFSQEQAKNNKVCMYVPAYSKGRMYERKGRVDIRRYYSVPLPTYKDLHLTVPDILDIYKSLHEFGPDVIHFHTPGTMGLVGILMAKIMRVPLVGTYHTLFSEVLDYVSVRKLVDKYLVAIDKAAAGVGLDLGLLRNGEVQKEGETAAQRFTWSVVNRIYNYADIIICPTGAIARELWRRKISRSKVVVISNGMDLKMFTPKKNYRRVNKWLHVGRLGFEKNTDVVIKAFARSAGSLNNLKLVIAGDGPARKDLEKLAGELGIRNRVKFLGMMRHEKLPWVYRDADVFLTASDMETLGLVVLEAMACGLPVVAVDKYAMCDLVEEGVNGFRVKPGDEQAMSERGLQLMADEPLRQEMGVSARKTAEKHDLAEVIAKMEQLYQRIGSKSELAVPKNLRRTKFSA